MLRGLWEFRPINQKTLGFLMNDELLFIDSHARDKNWLRVASIHGHVGYVPINFVELLENVDLGKLLGFLDEAIRRARQDRNRSLDCLLTFRDGLVTSPVPPDEMIMHMEAEIKKLRAKSISELSNENSNMRSSYQSSDAQEVTYTTTIQTSKGVGSSSARIDMDETGSPKAGYHHSSSRSHHQHQHQESSPHLQQQHPYETESDLFPSPIITVDHHRTSHGSGGVRGGDSHSSGYRTKSRGKKHKKQSSQQPPPTPSTPATVPTIISSVDKPLQSSHHGVISYSSAGIVDMPHYHPSDYPIKPCAAQTSLHSDSVVPTYPEISSVVVDTSPVVISTIDDVEIVPPPPLPNDDVNEMQFLHHHHHHSNKIEPLLVEPPSYFSVPDLTSQPRKWSIASGDKPVDPKLMAGEMIDVVRSATGLSHKKCQMAAQVVLGYIQECMVDLPGDLIALMRHLDNPKAISENLDVIAHSSDTYSMQRIFRFLKKCQADEQQRSWALHEDESVILEHLHELNKILEDADPSISRYALEQDKYSTVNTLVLFYQMETRWSIRSKLIDTFAALCKIDLTALSVLLNSILPMELAREIRESLGDQERLTHCASLLFLILQTGENLPISHYEHLGLDFLSFVYDVIECPPDDDESITDIFANVVFALNLQFPNVDDNLTIKALSERDNAKVFTQKIIYYLNREVDPINVLELEYSELLKKPQHSVFKMTRDILSCKRTTDLFYTNDIKVLIDIVTRNLTDLGPGEARRTLYLQMIQRIIRNSNYSQHMHRIDDLRSCLVSILIEEDLQALPDQIIIRDMAKEFSFLF